MSQSDKAQVTVECVVDVSVEKAWAVWTGVDHIVQWNAASADWHTTRAENDLTVGGRFTSRMEAKDGSVGFDFGGVYTEVEHLKVIRYRMDDDRKVEVIFTAIDESSTRVTETFDPENTHPVEFQKQGWQAIIDNFKAHAEKV